MDGFPCSAAILGRVAGEMPANPGTESLPSNRPTSEIRGFSKGKGVLDKPSFLPVTSIGFNHLKVYARTVNTGIRQ